MNVNVGDFVMFKGRFHTVVRTHLGSTSSAVTASSLAKRPSTTLNTGTTFRVAGYMPTWKNCPRWSGSKSNYDLGTARQVQWSDFGAAARGSAPVHDQTTKTFAITARKTSVVRLLERFSH